MVFPIRFQTKIIYITFISTHFCMLLIILKYHAKQKRVKSQ